MEEVRLLGVIDFYVNFEFRGRLLEGIGRYMRAGYIKSKLQQNFLSIA